MVIQRRMRRRSAWALALSLGLIGASGCRDDLVEGADDDTGSTGTSAANDDETPADSTGGTDEPEPTAGDTNDTDDPEEEAVPPPGGVRRLLSHQYVSSIYYLLGAHAAVVATPPPDPSLGTFDALATLTSVPSVPDLESYEDSSHAVAETAVLHSQRLAQFVPCVADGPFDDSCYETMARDFGRVAWRRPLTDAQVERLVLVATNAREWGADEFMVGVQYMLTAILQSPYFLYLVEVGEPGDDYRELNGYELATRMSFFLSGRTPEIGMLDRAEAGELDSDEGVRALAWDLLERPQSRDTVGRLFAELLTVRHLASKGKDPELFPTFSPQLAASMLEETRLLVDDVVFTQDQSILRLFDSDHTFIDDELAALYGYEPVGGGWTEVPLPAGRAGVLSLSGWLSMSSHNTVNSPTRRGLYVMEQLLCNEVPLPPPRVNPAPIEPSEGQTLRESLSQHMEDPACAGCHTLTDPIGFGFEHLNPIGAWQALDNGQPVDASGTLPGVGDYYGADELAALLVDTPALPRCLVDKVYAGGLGFVPNSDLEPALDDVNVAFVEADHNLKQLLVELTTSPVFRLVDEPK